MTPELTPIDVPMPRTQCEARLCVVSPPPLFGPRCREHALPGDALCWTHRASVDLGIRSEADVHAGRTARA